MITVPDKIADPFLERLQKLYADMDASYAAVAENYGFHCSGCVDNCCRTRFYHHTHLEYLYLRQGFRRLSRDLRRDIRQRAAEVRRETALLEKTGGPIRLMCPLNAEGLCLLYPHRPMICRLHGLAHELHRPDLEVSYGPGCDAFTRQSEGKGYRPFDRTPFYMRMARMEAELKQAADITRRLKMTIAEMIEIL